MQGEIGTKKEPHIYDHIRQDMARLALAGLRRPAYAGIFRTRSDTRVPAWTAEILLDGYRRSLDVTLARTRGKPEADPGRSASFRARITGLRPFAARLDIPMTGSVRNGQSILTGSVGLGAAVLHLSAIPSRSADGRPLLHCQLEIRQGREGAPS